MIRILLDTISCPSTAADLIHDIESVCRGKDMTKVDARLTFGHEGPCLAFYVTRAETDDELAAEKARRRALYDELQKEFG